MAPGVTYSKVNLGPLTVRGGRHTFGVLHDAGEEFAEQSETDNDTSDQWIWSPYTLTSGTGVIRSAPPSRIGGWDALPPGSPRTTTATASASRATRTTAGGRPST
jgi:hypothetical protein